MVRKYTRYSKTAPGPIAGQRKRDFQVYKEDGYKARIPIPRTNQASQLDTENIIRGPLKQGTIAYRIALRAITNFVKEEHLLVTKRQINSNRRVDNRITRRQ